MNETMVTVVGNVATAPVFRELPSGSVARFRVAATARQRDRTTGVWSDGHTNFFTVWAWRSLGANAAASLSVGEPVIVQGRLKVRAEERGEHGGGQQWMSADIDAFAIGHDLSRGTAAFRRAFRTEAGAGERQLAPTGEGQEPRAVASRVQEPAPSPLPAAEPAAHAEPTASESSGPSRGPERAAASRSARKSKRESRAAHSPEPSPEPHTAPAPAQGSGDEPAWEREPEREPAAAL